MYPRQVFIMSPYLGNSQATCLDFSFGWTVSFFISSVGGYVTAGTGGDEQVVGRVSSIATRWALLLPLPTAPSHS